MTPTTRLSPLSADPEQFDREERSESPTQSHPQPILRRSSAVPDIMSMIVSALSAKSELPAQPTSGSEDQRIPQQLPTKVPKLETLDPSIQSFFTKLDDPSLYSIIGAASFTSLSPLEVLLFQKIDTIREEYLQHYKVEGVPELFANRFYPVLGFLINKQGSNQTIPHTLGVNEKIKMQYFGWTSRIVALLSKMSSSSGSSIQTALVKRVCDFLLIITWPCMRQGLSYSPEYRPILEQLGCNPPDPRS